MTDEFKVDSNEYEQRVCAIREKRIEYYFRAIKAWNPENDDITELAVTFEELCTAIYLINVFPVGTYNQYVMLEGVGTIIRQVKSASEYRERVERIFSSMEKPESSFCTCDHFGMCISGNLVYLAEYVEEGQPLLAKLITEVEVH